MTGLVWASRWIETYEDTRQMDDRVHTALQAALDRSNITAPIPTQAMRLGMDSPPLPLSPPHIVADGSDGAAAGA